MNGPEHYRLAEKCMSSVDGDDSMSLALLAEAQVHAALALTAATALGAVYGPENAEVAEAEAWDAVAAVSPGLTSAAAGALVVAEQWQPRVDHLRALLGRAVRELADSGLPSQNALGAELARDGGIEL